MDASGWLEGKSEQENAKEKSCINKHTGLKKKKAVSGYSNGLWFGKIFLDMDISLPH